MGAWQGKEINGSSRSCFFRQTPSISAFIFQESNIRKSPAGPSSSASQILFLFAPSLRRGDPGQCWPGDLPPASLGWHFARETERQAGGCGDAVKRGSSCVLPAGQHCGHRRTSQAPVWSGGAGLTEAGTHPRQTALPTDRRCCVSLYLEDRDAPGQQPRTGDPCRERGLHRAG